MENFNERRDVFGDYFLEFKNFLPSVLSNFIQDNKKREFVAKEILKQIKENKKDIENLKDINFSKNFVEGVFLKIKEDEDFPKNDAEDSDSILAISEAISTWSKLSF